jgi:membrane-associated phospholipid phosphatase
MVESRCRREDSGTFVMSASAGAHAAGPAARPAWHPVPLIAGVVAVLVLFGSWLGQRWSAADEAVFRYFNSQLGRGAATTFWAITNWRPFDIVSAALIGAFVLAWLRQADAAELEERVAQFVGFCLLLVAVKGIEHLLLYLLHYQRQSPSLAYADAIRLSRLVTWITVKDSGATVFPGDHAFVLFATVGFLRIHAGRAMGIAAALVLLPLAVPRLAGGAHWLSDVMVGGLCMAVLLLCAAYATPLGCLLSRAIRTRGGRPLAACIALGRRLRLLP